MKKRKLVITIAIIFIIISIFCIARYIIVNNKNEIQNKENNQTENWDNQYSEVDKNDINYNNTDDVEKLKEQMGLTAPSDIYEISEEFDGRKTLNVKAEILYKTAFVGIVNQEKPEMENLDKVFETKYPTRSGIWISERAKEKIVKILNENLQTKYSVDTDGYLNIADNSKQNEKDKKIEQIIKSNKKIILDICDFDYEIDNVSGEIVEYPFSQLGDTIDIVNNNEDKILVISESKIENVSNNDIIENLIDNI